ncbi:MAG: metal ABC transporter substrate-binding protein [Phycisphaeraceae bacterium]|nr:metal ABC transporter substrate-binding protein [Phycisphaeraceae bacterium]
MIGTTRRWWLVGLVAVLAGVAATSAGCPAPGGGTRQRVAATFTIIADMARNVAGDRLEVVSITKPGAEIHEYEPTPQDIVRAKGATLVLDNGLGLERWFEKFHQSIGSPSRVVVSAGIEPIGIGEGPYSGKPNPHAWMSPRNAKKYAENIRDALIRIDPAGEADYRRNTEQYCARLDEVDAYLRERLSVLPEDQRVLATSEGAFSYLCRDYGLTELYLWPVNADQEGTPQQVKKVIDEVRARKVAAVFAESTISDKPMRQVARETGARFGGVLYVDSLTEENGPADSFLSLLTTNATTIVRGLLGPDGQGGRRPPGGASGDGGKDKE